MIRPLFGILVFVAASQTSFAETFSKADFNALMNSDQWQMVDDEPDLQTWKLRLESRPLILMKGEATLDYPVSQVVQVWMNGNRKAEWLEGFSSAKQIGGSIEGNSVTELSVYDNPWPIADRDFVYRIDLSHNKDLNVVEFDLTNVTSPDAPPSETAGVRGEVMMTLHLKPIDGGKKTHFVGMFYADLKGMIPVWLQNYIASSFPRGTIRSLKEQLAKGAPHHPVGLELQKAILEISEDSVMAH